MNKPGVIAAQVGATAPRFAGDRHGCMAAAIVGPLLSCLLGACGGGGGTNIDTPPAAVDYPNSLVLGLSGHQDVVYTPAVGVGLATITAARPSTLMPSDSALVIAEYRAPALSGVAVECVSGEGDSTNVITGINLGVIDESAVILLDATWTEVNWTSIWPEAAASASAWNGWENCGAKPEGAPSRSSHLVATADGGFTEDVYDGNPATSFSDILRIVSPQEVEVLASDAGELTTQDPLRPLQITLRAYVDSNGHHILVEIGVPAAGAPSSARGFIALYVPA